MKKFVWLYITFGIVICMVGCGTNKSISKEDTQESEMVNTTNPTDDQVVPYTYKTILEL